MTLYKTPNPEMRSMEVRGWSFYRRIDVLLLLFLPLRVLPLPLLALVAMFIVNLKVVTAAGICLRVTIEADRNTVDSQSTLYLAHYGVLTYYVQGPVV